ncbi:hypothetical protein CAQU_10135 [Corynebacterium aquilae DSM 44791]|uniref:Uncharacterized protein n=1 Tax=Corynebacterium aquilae DSM 44791 TaxID=1431546 RepID=A0A1L7CHM7_9CORY|nr:hypothetical protein CAQU_10135 [Corynebacterium aquilae DSM 44791]
MAGISQHVWGGTMLEAAEGRPAIVWSTVVVAMVGSLLLLIPLSFVPVAVADGHSFAFGVAFFRQHRMATVGLVAVTLAVVGAALGVARFALYLLPLFAPLVPIIALMWIEAYWQGMEPVDERSGVFGDADRDGDADEVDAVRFFEDDAADLQG